MKHNEKGYMPFMGLYSSRYYAKKAACNDDVVVKVDGGYKIMSASEYSAWRKKQ